MTARRVVVVGADAAGMSAAHTALRGFARAGEACEIVAFEKTDHTSYSACGIPYWISGTVPSSDDLTARTPEQHRAMGVDLRVLTTATSLDVSSHTLGFVGPDGEGLIAFDDLVLATGARPVIPKWAVDETGTLLGGIRPVKNLWDGEAWIDLLTARDVSPRSAVVVGGGYIGLEMAEALIDRGVHVTLLTRSAVMSSLDPDMSERIRLALETAGVEVITSSVVISAEADASGARVAELVTDSGRRLPADLVVLALGVQAETELGADAGLPVGLSGAYAVDAHGRLGDGIWAAGDCCESLHRVTGKPAFVPLGTHANKQGRVVGDNLVGGDSSFPGVLATAVTRFAAGGQHIEIGRTGLSTREAEAAGFDPLSLVTEGRTASGYMPEARPAAVKVIADRTTRRLLGAQIVGGQGSAKRIDTIASALWGELSIDDLAAMDLAYAPPLATVWEVVQLAGRRLADRMPM